MLIFEEARPRFAKDTETGEIFGLTAGREPDEKLGAYIVDGVTYRVQLRFSPGLPSQGRPPQIVFLCASVQWAFKALLTSDPEQTSAFVLRLLTAFARIQRERPFVEGAVLTSDFKEWSAGFAAKGEEPPFRVPSDEYLASIADLH